jgi:dihydroorotase
VTWAGMQPANGRDGAACNRYVYLGHTMTASFSINKPDDFHVHLRDGAALSTTVPHTAAVFARALVMPNLAEPVDSLVRAMAYQKRIMAALPEGQAFEPLFALYLTQDVTEKMLREAAASASIMAMKWYPGKHTTGSAHGVSDVGLLRPLFSVMEQLGLVLCVHAETAGPDVDAFDREKHFIQHTLTQVKEDFPDLKIVVEHVTNASTVAWIKQAGPKVAGTLTAHHLWINRNDLIHSTIQPHYFCLPVAKRRDDQEALIEAAISGSPQFFLGTDSAPHPIGHKEASHGCAGVYTAHAALCLYAQAFTAQKALKRLDFFASKAGAAFYGLPPSRETLTLVASPWQVPEAYPFGARKVQPFGAGQRLDWQVSHA